MGFVLNSLFCCDEASISAGCISFPQIIVKRRLVENSEGYRSIFFVFGR